MSTELTPILSIEESEILREQELIIEQGLNTFVVVGTALMVIRDQRLYREDFDSFEDYCQINWGFTSRHSNRMIEAASIVTALGPIGPTPTTESQARELTGLAPETAAAVMETAAQSGKVTAASIREARETHGVAKVTQTTKTETIIDSETGEVIDSRAWAVAKFPVLDVPQAPDAEVVEIAKAVLACPERDHDMRAEIGAKSLALSVRRANGEVPMPVLREDMGKHFIRLNDDALIVRRHADAMVEWFMSLPIEDRGLWSSALRTMHNELGALLGRITEPSRLKVVQ